MDFLIALQTHSISNNQDSISGFKRYGCDDKREITKRCVRSLVVSLNYASLKHPSWKFRLHVFDDHSDEETVNLIKDILGTALIETSFTSLDTYGLIPSLRQCYLDLKENGKHLVMQAQDDYLFDEICFYQCIQTWYKFSPKFEKPISLFPYDDPYRYWDENLSPVRIVHGPDRHWRQVYQTPCTFITHHQIMLDNWDLFEKFTEGDSLDPRIEDTTVNLLWQQREYVVISPIPSLALHFQTDAEKDPYIDWKSWWDKHADSVEDNSRLSSKLDNTSKKKLLNIGSGETLLNEQSNYYHDNEWVEIRADVVASPSTDVCTSLIGLEGIPSNSMDCVWASHVVEHCDWFDLPIIFNSILRVLNEEGFAIIRVPDIGSISHLIANDLLGVVYESAGVPISPIDMIYGSRAHVKAVGEYMRHKVGFTKRSMEQILTSLDIKYIIKDCNFELRVFLFKEEPPLEAFLSDDLVL